MASVTFEVDATCRGAHWERKKDGLDPGDRLVTTIRDLEDLLRLVEQYGAVRIVSPREGRRPRVFRLELRG